MAVYTYLQFDPPLDIDRNARGGTEVLRVSEAASKETGRERLRTLIIQDRQSPRRDVVSLLIRHDREAGPRQYQQETDEVVPIRFVYPVEFHIYEIERGLGYATTNRRVIRDFLTRLEATDPSSLPRIAVRSVNLAGLERTLSDLPYEVNINGYYIGSLRMDQVRTAQLFGCNIDRNVEVRSWVERGEITTVQCDITYEDMRSTVTITGSGSIILATDLGEGPSLDFVRWLDQLVATNSELVLLPMLRHRRRRI